MHRLLYATHHWPWPPTDGGAQRSAMIVQALVAEWDVTFFLAPPTQQVQNLPGLLQAPVPLDIVTVFDEGVRCWSPHDWWAPASTRVARLLRGGLPTLPRGWLVDSVVQRLRALRQSQQYDVVWATQPWAAEAVRAAGFPRVVCDLWDLPSQWLGRELANAKPYRSKWLHHLEVSRLARYERSLPRRFQAVVVCKDEERRAIVGSSEEGVHIVPNGAVFPARCEWHPATQEAVILFVGRLSYTPNVDGILYFAREVFPAIRKEVPRAQLRIVGAAPPQEVRDLHRDGLITVVGFADDLAAEYASASVVVAPLRRGGGTKIKAIEALGFARPLVATPVGAEGLDLIPDVHFLQGRNADELAAACVRVLRSEETGRRIASAGRNHVASTLSWEAVGSTVRAVGRQVCSTPVPAGRQPYR